MLATSEFSCVIAVDRLKNLQSVGFSSATYVTLGSCKTISMDLGCAESTLFVSDFHIFDSCFRRPGAVV